MNTNEEIGRSYKTLDNDPISHFHDPRVQVEIFPDTNNNTSASITCPDLDYNSGTRKFNTEQEAKLFAMNMYDKLISRLDAGLVERVIARLLLV